MSTPCEKHALLPVVGQSPCAGCEIERLMAESEALHAQVDTLAEWYANSLNECTALRKDAERWRFIAYEWPKVKLVENAPWFNACFLEREIDALMSKAPLANPGQ